MGRVPRGLLIAVVLPALTVGSLPVRAETPEEWITLGRRVHGGFGTFIPVGIRIGLDAMKRLEAKPREFAVVYFDSDKAPCACFGDGVMIAVTATPGQRSFTMSPQKAPAGAAAVIEIRHKQTGKGFRYTVAESWLLKLAGWNRTLNERGRYDAVIEAQDLYTVEEIK